MGSKKLLISAVDVGKRETLIIEPLVIIIMTILNPFEMSMDSGSAYEFETVYRNVKTLD